MRRTRFIEISWDRFLSKKLKSVLDSIKAATMMISTRSNEKWSWYLFEIIIYSIVYFLMPSSAWEWWWGRRRQKEENQVRCDIFPHKKHIFCLEKRWAESSRKKSCLAEVICYFSYVAAFSILVIPFDEVIIPYWTKVWLSKREAIE